ncbi:MAG: hypothetical protein KDA37_14420 [Planctomycetales bacterium]|nr:hypothetical protein [Planctomycetales bacterium]
MDIQLGILYWTLLAVALQVLVDRVCARAEPLRRHQTTLRIAALVWMLMPLAKKLVIDDLVPPSDAIEHEAVAREVAGLLQSGQFGLALGYFRIGNEAYRFLLGVFYAATLAPEVITYAVHSALGFWGLLALLEVACLLTSCRRMPGLAVWITAFLPSGLLWCSANLKEGVTLWGLCMMLYWTVDRRQMRLQRRGMPLAGMLGAALMRPHIVLMWLGAMGFAAVVKSRRYGIGVTAAIAIALCFFSLKIIAPNMYDVLVHEGLTESLSQKYDLLTENGDAAGRQFVGAQPIPVYTGLTLILLRPWPNEVFKANELIAGLEVWLLTLWGAWNWKNVFKSARFLKDANLIGLVVGLLLFGFLFSYMYNMGLVARQRLMAFPAVLLIYMWPLLASQTHAVTRPAPRRVPSRPPIRRAPSPVMTGPQ